MYGIKAVAQPQNPILDKTIPCDYKSTEDRVMWVYTLNKSTPHGQSSPHTSAACHPNIKYSHGKWQHHCVITITGGQNRFGHNTQSPQVASPDQQISIRLVLSRDNCPMRDLNLNVLGLQKKNTHNKYFPPCGSWSSGTIVENTDNELM